MKLNNPMTVAGWGVTREGSSFLAEMLQEVKVGPDWSIHYTE